MIACLVDMSFDFVDRFGREVAVPRGTCHSRGKMGEIAVLIGILYFIGRVPRHSKVPPPTFCVFTSQEQTEDLENRFFSSPYNQELHIKYLVSAWHSRPLRSLPGRTLAHTHCRKFYS